MFRCRGDGVLDNNVMSEWAEEELEADTMLDTLEGDEDNDFIDDVFNEDNGDILDGFDDDDDSEVGAGVLLTSAL